MVLHKNNAYSGTASSDINANAIEEVTAQTGGFDAEYGRVLSGIVQVTTRTGGDSYKVNTDIVTDELFGDESVGFNRYNLSIGGPLMPDMKDHSFFLSFDYKSQDDPAPRYNVTGARQNNGRITRNLVGSFKRSNNR